MRGRSYSYSPSPPRGYSRRYRSPSPTGRYGGRGRDPPTSLLVRNLRLDTRSEDLRGPFGEFGPVKDIYLPRDYYTGDEDTNEVIRVLDREPRGFGFIQYVYPEDAQEAKYQMDGQVIRGREITVVFAEENRKKPSEMRARQRLGSRSRSRGSYYSRSPRHGRYYSRSPRYARSYSRSPDYYSPSPRRRSISPRDRKYRGRSYSRSPYGSRSRSESPVRGRSCSRSWSRSRSRSYEGY